MRRDDLSSGESHIEEVFKAFCVTTKSHHFWCQHCLRKVGLLEISVDVEFFKFSCHFNRRSFVVFVLQWLLTEV